MSIKIMTDVWEKSPVKDGREIVGLLALADWADDYGGAFPAYDVLAWKMRCSERQAMRVIANLSEAGELFRLPEEMRQGSFFKSNLFVVLSGCRTASEIAERILMSANLKGIKLSITDIPTKELHETRTIYLANNPLVEKPKKKRGVVDVTHDPVTHDTPPLSPMTPNTSYIRHTDTKQIVTGTAPVTRIHTLLPSQPSLLEETDPLASTNGAVKVKEKPKRKPTPLYRTYERLAELQFGINKEQTLKEVKRLLEIGATPDEIVELGEYLLTHDAWIAEHGLNASLLVKRWQGWVKQGKPTIKQREVVEFSFGRNNDDVIDFSFKERGNVPTKR